MSKQHPFDSLKTSPVPMDKDALRQVTGKLLGVPVLHIDYDAKPLHGGTLGDVQLIEGNARTTSGETLAFRLVQKTQRQWLRPGDPQSWRREYDLFQSDFHTLWTDTFKSPAIYGAQKSETETRLYMAYAEGTSGATLTLDDLALATQALGRFQARCHAQASTLQSIPCLSDAGAMRRDFAQWTPDTAEYKYLHSAGCALPPQLKHMLLDIQQNADAVFSGMARLPQVLCHRDYWTENIFVAGGRVIAIDWDCAGWGVPGEDLASLIADETPDGQIGAYAKRLLPAYYKGIGESLRLPPMEMLPLRQMILFKFGYRLLQQLMYAPSQALKDSAVQKLAEINALP